MIRCRLVFRAFTLIEVLVVIAIIAVISALALPAFSRSREQSKRSKCLGHMRQVYGAVGAFAAQNDGEIPIGYRMGKKQFATTLYSGGIGKYVLLGKLFETGFITDPAVLFCPSERDPKQAWNTPENSWPPASGNNTQGGYACAPLVDWGTEEAPKSWPRLATLERGALLSDGFGLPARVDSRHIDGINVLSSDGSAEWVLREKIDGELRQCESLGSQANDAQQRIWDILSGKDPRDHPANSAEK